MRIESIRPPVREGKAYRLTLEGGQTLFVSGAEMADFALHGDMELSDSAWEALQKAAQQRALREKAAQILSYAPHSRGEVREKLRRFAAEGGERPQNGGAPSETAMEDALDWAESLGLLNDEDYARTLVRHCCAKGYGYYKIKDELYRRRVPRELWETALAEAEEPDGAVDRYLAKRGGNGSPQELKKASDALARRGFSWEAIREGIERFCGDAGRFE